MDLALRELLAGEEEVAITVDAIGAMLWSKAPGSAYLACHSMAARRMKSIEEAHTPQELLDGSYQKLRQARPPGRPPRH